MMMLTIDMGAVYGNHTRLPTIAPQCHEIHTVLVWVLSLKAVEAWVKQDHI